jgi:hypothetical protein
MLPDIAIALTQCLICLAIVTWGAFKPTTDDEALECSPNTIRGHSSKGRLSPSD